MSSEIYFLHSFLQYFVQLGPYLGTLHTGISCSSGSGKDKLASFLGRFPLISENVKLFGGQKTSCFMLQLPSITTLSEVPMVYWSNVTYLCSRHDCSHQIDKRETCVLLL